MNDNHTEELVLDVSDEALEAAAKEKAGLWTTFCSGISCPGSPA